MPKMKLALASLFLGLRLGLPAHAQDVDEQQFAMALMQSMNRHSITYNREVCGYILRDQAGRLSSSKSSWGGRDSCAMMDAPAGMRIISSWHTHAAFDPRYDNEVPSTIDVEGDMGRGTNGWVATPAGRLWFIDGQTGVMRQVCGKNCLPADPYVVSEPHPEAAKTYTLDQLYRRFGG